MGVSGFATRTRAFAWTCHFDATVTVQLRQEIWTGLAWRNKHLEVQHGWVQNLVRKKEVEVLRNGGTGELTRVVGGVQLQRQMAQLNMTAGIGAKLCGFSLSL